MPTHQSKRDLIAKMKLIPIHDLIEGKSLLLIDDSIVRGTTSKRIVKLLRDAGAKEIHMRISAPPFLYPCYYGTDIDSEENLIACHHSVDEIAGMIGADSLGYLPIGKLNKLISSEDYCAACFRGNIRRRFRQICVRTVLKGSCLNGFERKRCMYDEKI